jgi:hypothetical protein
MTIRNFTNVALAVAAIAFAAPMAHAQNGMYSSSLGMYNNGGYNLLNSYNNGSTFGMYNNGGAYNLLNAYGNIGSFYGYAPIYPGAFGVGPYYNRYDNPGGALVLGSDGQLYNPFLGNGATEPTLDADGITIPAPVVPVVPVSVAEPTPVRMSDQIDMVRLSGNRIRIKWSGDPRPIATMTFSLLDRNRAALKSTMLSDMPAQAVFTVPSNAAYYRVVITYNDGAMRSLVTAL